ncbi:MAG: hypothetical protein C4B58_04390 [Deltaproteobacteria bacterium]|nr:MAG: hypothetical protein C4B58_04390 [Deltaproteobacteria bacterium]
MAKKKKGEKKRLKRLKRLKAQKLNDLIGKDNHAFIKAHCRLYTNPEHSPYKEAFYNAVHKEAIHTLSDGHCREAKDLIDALPDRPPLALLIDVVSCLSEGRDKEASILLHDLNRIDGTENFSPLITDLNSLLEAGYPDLDRLNASIDRTLAGQTPRPRMSNQAAKDVWTLFRLLHRPERDGYQLPNSYWRDLENCISNLRDRGIQNQFLEQVDMMVQMQKAIRPYLPADSNRLCHILGLWADDIRRLIIGQADHPLPMALEHLAQCVRVTCYELLTQPGAGTGLIADYSDILVDLMDVNDTERVDLQKAINALSNWQSIVEERDFKEIRRMLCEQRNRQTLTAQNRFLMDIGLYNLAVQADSEEDLFPDFFMDRKSQNINSTLDSLDSAAGTIEYLPQKDRREAALVVLARLNQVKHVPMKSIGTQGEIRLTLSKYLPKDGTLMLAAYAALMLSGSLKVVARRTRETLSAKGKTLNYNELQGPLLNLFWSTIDEKYCQVWEDIIVLGRELVQEQWQGIEQKLASTILAKWMSFGEFMNSPLTGIFSGFSDSFPHHEMIEETKQVTDDLLRFGHRLFHDNPEILAMGVLKILTNTPKTRRKSALDREFKKLSLPVKWRVAVYLGTMNILGIEHASSWELTCQALYRVLPGIPHDFEHWEKIVSCVNEMGNFVPRRKNKQYRELRQLLLKKLKDVQARVDSDEMRDVIGDYIDQL